ncbi:Ribonuclease clavin [Colletotrichum spinosum]|uniref:Ribonuclease clavin n=1 Tax=Colletotrichum spinosum TaxID=1347390 RepID=A0A4R8PRX1_9PEZI|nr:Ribonuclease clavin [Colletotrichum spinosum]
MHSTKILVLLAASAASVLAVAVPPSDQNLQARAATVSCKPKINLSTEKFVVNVDHAKAEAKKAGFTDGKSGYPHLFQNHDGIKWGVHNCDDKKNPLQEYPVYWQGYRKQTVWNKEVKVKEQESTPLRVVYANKKGSIIYCGVMTHSKVEKNNRGLDNFQKCD